MILPYRDRGHPTLLVTVLAIVSVWGTGLAQSTISEDTRTILTYPFSDPDPIPILGSKPEIYPYFKFDGYADKPTNQEWKVVRLENDHVRILILPEVGGKIYGAIDKRSGRDFIYMNDVLKFRRIALRGPWTSGGLEFNFGIVGHAPTTATPVDYLLRENPDGSVSCFVGALDLTSRTRWTVEIRLPSDAAAFETRTHWYNPTPFAQSNYSWSTAAIHTADDLRYFYPGTSFIPHDPTVAAESWPVDSKGRDLSKYRNNNFRGSKSHFVIGEYAHHFGTYSKETDTGLGHWALYDDMPGRKVWLWALSRQGGIWEDLLTDNSGQYSEPQAGRLFSQTDHDFLSPLSGDRWREVWFPIRGIEGLTTATPDVAFHIIEKDESLEVQIAALRSLNDSLEISAGGGVIRREAIALAAGETTRLAIEAPEDRSPIRFRIPGKLDYSTDPTERRLRRPLEYRPLDSESAHASYLRGVRQEKQRFFRSALKLYKQAVEAEPLHLDAWSRLALLQTRQGNLNAALASATRALEIERYSPSANYAYGVASRRTGKQSDSLEALGWAARSPLYRVNAFVQMAEIYLQSGRSDLARTYASRANTAHPSHIRALELLAILARKQGRWDDAQQLRGRLSEVDPLNPLIGWEKVQVDVSASASLSFRRSLRSEMPDETVLELSMSYLAVGLQEEATGLLRMLTQNPVALYWLSFLQRDSEPDISRQLLKQAAALSPERVFPHRVETLPVLQWAVQESPGGWKGQYYLGLLLWGLGRDEEAHRVWLELNRSDFASFFVARSQLGSQLALGNPTVDALRANRLAPDDWRTWHHLIRAQQREPDFTAALRSSTEAVARFGERFLIQIDHARTLVFSGRSGDAIEVLQQTQVLPSEAARDAHDLWRMAHLNVAMDQMEQGRWSEALAILDRSRSYPENLGSGRPFDPDFRAQDLLASRCQRELGNETATKAAHETALDFTMRNWDEWGNDLHLGVVVLQQAGRFSDALRLNADLKARYPSRFRLLWALARVEGDRGNAGRTEGDEGRQPEFATVARVLEAIRGN